MTEANSNIILATWDFTEKAEFALKHAVNSAKALHYEIGLFHIVKKDSEIPAAEEKLIREIDAKYSDLGCTVKPVVHAGNIFTTITDIANDMGAHMIYMGTHGIKGMQKLMGSWALKVIANTKMPFVVVQAPPKNNDLKNIIIPVNFRKENKECVNWALYYSRNFGTKFHILTAKHTDTNFIKGIESNIFFIRKFFNARDIDYDMIEMPNKTEFFKEVTQYGSENNIDAIMVMTTKDIGFADYVLGAQEQYIIANEHEIPVICINPRPPKIGGSFNTAGG